ncbi:TerC/Alx family metal homeostasis membrane protein [Fulvivirga ligni]|uniref:TerC/Alx family metal homeostasis membrane protein n=1 Tax=Fulvivirga ligni TaxID=2904246 RepID=UPI001F3E1588|nr:TerC/Alx family metal homeostasis membrane protein [Fulvivirga ligni]UII18991.1 TerC/Alx family metal homeostasis membrane protein [Fulvivirga ligni]
MKNEVIFFAVFITVILFIILLDLLLLSRKSVVMSTKEALSWSLVWIGLALGFALFLRLHAELIHGIENMEDLKKVASKFAPFLVLNSDNYQESIELYRINTSTNFLSGYLIEKSLSVDNLFVIMTILASFSVRKSAYKSVLFWGIIGAIVMRCIFIFAGAALIEKFEWSLYIFGVYLLYMGFKMYLDRNKEEAIQTDKHPVLKFISKYANVFPRYVGNNFVLRIDKVFYITPLFIVLVIIEFTDLIFAMDSIPAIFAVTRDPYIVFFSNIFAILGLRTLFFLLINIIDKFHLIKVGVSILLVYVGLKLILHEWLLSIGFKPVYSLYFILTILVSTIILSLVFPKKQE